MLHQVGVSFDNTKVNIFFIYYIPTNCTNVLFIYKQQIKTYANANHIIQNKHEFGPAETTLKLLKQCNKGSHMNCWEQNIYIYIQEYHRSGKLITEQQTYEYNPLFTIAQGKNEK